MNPISYSLLNPLYIIQKLVPIEQFAWTDVKIDCNIESLITLHIPPLHMCSLLSTDYSNRCYLI